MTIAARVLGSRRLQVAALGCGCWGMSHAYGRADESESMATIRAAVEKGIDFFDTADIYGGGHNERLLAKALGKARSKVILATKFGFVGREDGRFRIDGRPEYVRRACETSLKRLGTDYIDLYYMHRKDPQVPIEETVGAMADLVSQGKVRFLGLSEVSADTLEKANAVWPISTVQSEYSLWCRLPESSLLPACRRLKVGFVAFSPLGRGFLTGKIRNRKDLAPDDYRRNLPRFQSRSIEQNRAALKLLEDVAAGMGVTPAQLALAWILEQGENIVPIVGMKTRAHLESNLEALSVSLCPEHRESLDQIAALVCGQRHDPFNLQFME